MEKKLVLPESEELRARLKSKLEEWTKEAGDYRAELDQKEKDGTDSHREIIYRSSTKFYRAFLLGGLLNAGELDLEQLADYLRKKVGPLYMDGLESAYDEINELISRM